MIISRVSVQPVKGDFAIANVSQNSEKIANLSSANDSFTPSNKAVSFKGFVGGGVGLGIGGLLAIAAAAATGVGAPAAIAMLIAGETVGAKAGSKVGDILVDDKKDD